MIAAFNGVRVALDRNTMKSPVVVPAAPEGAVASDGGGGTISAGDPEINAMIDKMFAKIGNLVSNLNVAHTGLSVSTT